MQVCSSLVKICRIHESHDVMVVCSLFLFAETVMRVMNKSTFMYQDTVLDSVTVMRIWAITLYIVSIVLMMVVLFVVVRPTVYAVENNKEGVHYLVYRYLFLGEEN